MSGSTVAARLSSGATMRNPRAPIPPDGNRHCALTDSIAPARTEGQPTGRGRNAGSATSKPSNPLLSSDLTARYLSIRTGDDGQKHGDTARTTSYRHQHQARTGGPSSDPAAVDPGGFSCSRTPQSAPCPPQAARTSASARSRGAMTRASPGSCWSRKSQSTECAASTKTGATVMITPFEPGRGYRLNPQVALRPEPFGALAYHYGNRRLTFLRDPLLVDLVRDLQHHESVDAALSASPIQPDRWPAFRRALASLQTSEVIGAR